MNIDSNENIGASQAIYSTNNFSVYLEDLALWSDLWGIPVPPVTSIGGGVFPGECPDYSLCTESALDIQMISSISQNANNSVWYSDEPEYLFPLTVLNAYSIPLVVSMSYGGKEYTTPIAEAQSFCDNVMLLGLLGTSFFIPSGDAGCCGSSTHTCGYLPNFPSSCPYVTTVGGTMGASFGLEEVVCQATAQPNYNVPQLGYGFTAGGGFSNYFPTPQWQLSAVQGYFKALSDSDSLPYVNASNTALSTFPFPQYNASGRGYPDLSVQATDLFEENGGVLYYVAGTSGAAPNVAALFSLINAARLADGLPSVGFINPAIYTGFASFTNDVTSGNISCASLPFDCCPQSLAAAVGWDAASGFGSVNFVDMKAYFMSLVQQPPTESPTPLSQNQQFGPAVFGIVTALFLVAVFVGTLIYNWKYVLVNFGCRGGDKSNAGSAGGEVVDVELKIGRESSVLRQSLLRNK